MDPTIQNLFYLGNYNGCISKLSNLNDDDLSDKDKVLKKSLEYRSYIGLKDNQIVLEDLGKDSPEIPVALRAVRLFAEYLEGDKDGKEQSVQVLNDWLSDPAKAGNPTLAVIAVAIYTLEENLVAALECVHQPKTVEMFHAKITTLIRMNRPDLAARALKQMQEFDNVATLTNLSSAQVGLAIGGTEKVQEAMYAFQDLHQKYGDCVQILNGLALCDMLELNFQSSLSHLETALSKNARDEASIVNSIICKTHLNQETKKLIRQLQKVNPNHPWLKERQQQEKDFERLSEQYKSQ